MQDLDHAPKQKRSQETRSKLLAATIAVLDEHGLAGATIPRIAERAGVAPGSVYRRFPDKESLFRAAFLDALAESNQVNAAAIEAAVANRTLAEVATLVARSIVAQYRLRPKLMRALIQFTEHDTDEAFRSKAMSLVASNALVFSKTIATKFSGEIAHDDALRAVTFATLAIANIAETNALEDFSLWKELLPLDDDQLASELQKTFLSYLTMPALQSRR